MPPSFFLRLYFRFLPTKEKTQIDACLQSVRIQFEPPPNQTRACVRVVNGVNKWLGNDVDCRLEGCRQPVLRSEYGFARNFRWLFLFHLRMKQLRGE